MLKESPNLCDYNNNYIYSLTSSAIWAISVSLVIMDLSLGLSSLEDPFVDPEKDVNQLL